MCLLLVLSVDRAHVGRLFDSWLLVKIALRVPFRQCLSLNNGSLTVKVKVGVVQIDTALIFNA